MGMPSDLKLQGNNISNAASAFFVAYLIAEIPNGACPFNVQLVETELGQSDLSYHWKPISYRKYRLRNG